MRAQSGAGKQDLSTADPYTNARLLARYTRTPCSTDLRRTIQRPARARGTSGHGSHRLAPPPEPRTIPMAALKILRAAGSGALLQRLLNRGGSQTQDMFYPEWHARHAAADGRRSAGESGKKNLELARRPELTHPLTSKRTRRGLPSPARSRALRAQLYPELAAVRAGRAPSRPRRIMLDQIAREDPRIHVVPVVAGKSILLNDLASLRQRRLRRPTRAALPAHPPKHLERAVRARVRGRRR